jgi:hypothetical protein
LVPFIEAEHFQAAISADQSGESSLVGGFDQYVDDDFELRRPSA